MGRINLYLEQKEDEKLRRFFTKWKVKSKEDVIKRMIRDFPEDEDIDDLTFSTEDLL